MKTALGALLLLLLAACGSVNLWPFGGGAAAERSLAPANAAEYRCEGNRRFYVRTLDANAVWLIAPDREIRLPRTGEGRYGVAKVVLELSADGATLVDPPASFTDCKRATAP